MKVVTTTPQLTEDDKRRLHDWLLQALVAEDHCCYDCPTGALSKLALFTDSGIKTLHTNSYWAVTDTKIYIGYDTRRELPLKDCLLVLLALTQFVEKTLELENTIATALVRYLSGEAADLHKAALIEAPVPMEGVAFNEDKVAMYLAGEWMTAAGETVDVKGWNVYATTLPAAPVTELDKLANALRTTPEVEF